MENIRKKTKPRLFPTFECFSAKLKSSVAFFLSFFLVTSGWSQTDNSFFSQNETFAQTQEKRWELRLAQLGFFKNKEVRSNLQNGYTLPGVQCIPTMAYQLDSQVLIVAGASFQRLFGDEKWFRAEPIIMFSYFSPLGRLNFGNLQGSLDHQLPETMMGYDQVIENRQETGIQWVGEHKRLTYDFWLDWQKAIREGDPFKEEFVAGFAGKWQMLEGPNFKVSIPGFASIFHSGGEIDQSTGTNASQYNFNTGLELDWGRFRLGALFDFYEDESTQAIDTFLDGWGQRIFVQYCGPKIQAELGYWDAHQFQAPQGEVMYQSLSRKWLGKTFHYRKMIWSRWTFQKPLGSYATGLFRVSTWFDAHQAALDFSVAAYIRWNLTIGLN